MKKYVITTDSTCDLPKSYVEENNLTILPLYFLMNDITYGGETTMNEKVFYDLMRKGTMPTTMACNPDSAENSFRALLKNGYDILHIGFSSALSSSCDSALLASKELESEFPNNKILVVDSLCASLGEGLLVHKALENLKGGMSLEDNKDWLEEHKLNICHQFTVDDLNHLHRGGRISKASAVIGTLISVKPVLHVNNNGELKPLSNARGRKKALHTLVDNMENTIGSYKDKNDIVFISHSDSVEDANFVANLIKEKFSINNFLINYISPTIGSHTGPGTIALFYMGDVRANN